MSCLSRLTTNMGTDDVKRQKKRLKPGDVLQIQLENSYSYIQFVGKHADYGDVIRVLSRRYPIPCHDPAAIANDTGYLAFYPAQAALRHDLVLIVGTVALPDGVDIPTVLRRRGNIDRHGKVLTWIIERDGIDTVREVLSDEERALPIASIWNHEMLLWRISENWRPEQLG